MRKSYVILIYVLILLLGAIGVSTLVWNDIDNKTITQEYYNHYLEHKEILLNQEEYATNSKDIEVVVNVQKNEVKDKYLVSTTFLNPKRNYRNIVILVVDKSELSKETDKVYPSIGIVGDFNNEFVTSNPNKKTTHSKITLNYECDSASKGVLIYFEYVDDAKTCISYLNVSVS